MAHPRRSRGRCHRGRASTRPYIACCTSTKYTGIISTKIHYGLHRVAVRATSQSPAHPHGAPRTFRGCCHRGRASTRPYIVCCKSIKYVGVTPRSCRGEWKLARHTCNADTQYIPVTHYMHKGCTGFPAQPLWLRVLIVILIDYNLLCRVVHDHDVESANKVIRSTVFAGVDYRAILAYDCHLCAWA